MIEGEVKYKNLGRSKAKGKLKINCETAEQFNDIMLGLFSQHLASSDVSFDNGKIYAGFRTVGEYKFIAVERLNAKNKN